MTTCQTRAINNALSICHGLTPAELRHQTPTDVFDTIAHRVRMVRAIYDGCFYQEEYLETLDKVLAHLLNTRRIMLEMLAEEFPDTISSMHVPELAADVVRELVQ